MDSFRPRLRTSAFSRSLARSNAQLITQYHPACNRNSRSRALCNLQLNITIHQCFPSLPILAMLYRSHIMYYIQNSHKNLAKKYTKTRTTKNPQENTRIEPPKAKNNTEPLYHYKEIKCTIYVLSFSSSLKDNSISFAPSTDNITDQQLLYQLQVIYPYQYVRDIPWFWRINHKPHLLIQIHNFSILNRIKKIGFRKYN